MRNAYYLMAVFLIVLLFFACSDKSDNKKLSSPHKKVVDSLTLVKKNETEQAGKLKHEIDSLKRHLDSIKAITSD